MSIFFLQGINMAKFGNLASLNMDDGDEMHDAAYSE